MDPAPLRFVITGAPGAGKSTLLAALAGTGRPCFAEVSRALIEEQAATGGRLLPWADLAGFATVCAERMRRQFEEGAAHRLSFYDRGLPDVIGYLRHGGLEPAPGLGAAEPGYAPVVFVAPPWREIHVFDSARPQCHREAEAIDRQLRRAYLELGYRLHELPRAPVAERVREVLRVAEEFL